MEWEAELQQAAHAISEAEVLLIGAGAGMGVDSGLPDFRGQEGFWKAYPPFRGTDFREMSNPALFERDSELAWGYFGHRLNLYRDTEPHSGFQTLLKWAKSKASYFVFTSNVDGHFQKAGFPEEKVVECHGSIHRMQCSQLCCDDIWTTNDLIVDVDHETIRATSKLPSCRKCGGLARPNILMFNDYSWVSFIATQQENRYVSWINDLRQRKLTTIEIGAGLAIPTVRHQCESKTGTLIRINPRDSSVHLGGISLPMGAKDAIEQIDALLATEAI